MKQTWKLIVAFVLVFALSACTECDECPACDECIECEPCDVCEECEECVVTPQLSFYETLSFPGSGYTPGYDYFLSGTLDEEGVITSIRIDMVSVHGTSKRSAAYDMNVAKFEIGGTAGNQTLKLFIGGSTLNISQVYNTIAGTLSADGSEPFQSIPFQLLYPGQVISNTEEIYALLADGLDITIDATTTVADVLSAAGLYDETNSLVKNGTARIELTGRWGGGDFNRQMNALEQHIVAAGLTLEEAYQLVAGNNQGYDNRDAVAGATVMFDAKIVAIFAEAAGVELYEEPVLIGTETEGTDTLYTLRTKGMYEMVVQVTIDDSGVITLMEVLSHNETEDIGAPVIDGTYLSDIVAAQDDLSQLDAIAGATLTSDALKDAATFALSLHNE